MTLKNRNLSYIGRELILNICTSAYCSVIREATGTENLQEKQNLRYFKSLVLYKIK